MDNLLIGDFEGPLDLLLHLIKKSKMEIFDIEISEITNQYLKYIEEMNELNLDIASEYLVMAAELIEMKSRKLLPRNEEEESSEEEENPEETLKKIEDGLVAIDTIVRNPKQFLKVDDEIIPVELAKKVKSTQTN